MPAPKNADPPALSAASIMQVNSGLLQLSFTHTLNTKNSSPSPCGAVTCTRSWDNVAPKAGEAGAGHQDPGSGTSSDNCEVESVIPFTGPRYQVAHAFTI